MLASYCLGDPMKESLIDYGYELATEIEFIKKPDVIIAHSMGCLVTRYAIESFAAGSYSKLKLILIEGPHNGLPNQGLSFSRITAMIFELIKRIPDWSVPTWDSWKDMMAGSDGIDFLNDGLEEKFKLELFITWLEIGLEYYEVGGMLSYLFPDTFSLPKQIPCKGKMILPTVFHSKLKSDSKVVDYIDKIIEE